MDPVSSMSEILIDTMYRKWSESGETICHVRMGLKGLERIGSDRKEAFRSFSLMLAKCFFS